MRRNKLLIPCPQCEGGNSKFYYTDRSAVCSYCNGSKKVNILDHHRTLNITDERNKNVQAFIADERFGEYLNSK